EWQGPVIGPGIEDWARVCDHEERRLDLTGLPEQIARELAWMAHWQAADGTRSSVFAMNQLASILRRAIDDHRPFPDSILDMDWEAAPTGRHRTIPGTPRRSPDCLLVRSSCPACPMRQRDVVGAG